MTLITRNTPKLTLAGAKAIVAAAEQRAAEIGVPMDIAVVDDGGHLLAFVRMDGAKLGSVEISIGKALSAALRRQPTGPVRTGDQVNLAVSLGLSIASHGKQTPVRGGVPLCSTASASAPWAPAPEQKIRTSTSPKPAQRPSKAPEATAPLPVAPRPCPTSSKSRATIFRDALAAVDIPRAMRQKLTRSGSRLTAGETTLDLAAYRSIQAVAIGKAVRGHGAGLAELLAPDIPVTGILVAPHDASSRGVEFQGFRSIGAGHPLPDAGSLAAARAILDLLAAADAHTLVFFLLSGGGSALVELPLDPDVTLSRPAAALPSARRMRRAHR